MGLLAWLTNLGMGGSPVTAVDTVVSQRYSLVGIDNQKFDLAGAGNEKFSLEGVDSSKPSLVGPQ